jgi:serine/threonine protein kinase/WD40 repeat protein/tetratricopeptide (TPR) repeat protein
MAPSSTERYANLLTRTADEPFVRETLAELEFDFRGLALVALAEWERLDIVAPELFRAVASLQRPSWGHWNGVIVALRAARRSIQRTGDAVPRERLQSAERLNGVLDLWDESLPEGVDLSVLARLTNTKESRPTIWLALTWPITLRNRVAHAPPADWSEYAAALRPLVSAIATGRLLVPAVSEESSPWILIEEGKSWLFAGIDGDFRVAHQSRAGTLKESHEHTAALMESLQRLLGKERVRDANFKRWLAQYATDDIKGVMLGDYLVGPPVGEGGFATVHRGVQLGTGRRVAVKILRDELRGGMGARFQREAEYLARINHRGVVSVLEHGEQPWIAPRAIDLTGEEWYRAFAKTAPVKSFLAMEWIEGRTLEAVFAESPRPDARTLCRWMADAAEALSHVHAAGLIHRDIKPGNILVTDEGRIVLADFGIARPRDDLRTLKTTAGHVLGTPAYMSPEQIRASNAEDAVGPEADVYALCATFYELFSGTRLFRHDTETAVSVESRKLAGERPERPRRITSGLPWEIDTILMGGLEPEISDRYRSARDLERDLRHALRDEPIEYRRPGLLRRARLFYRRHRLPVNLVAVFTLLAIAGVGQYVRAVFEEQQRTKVEQQRTKAEQGRTLAERNRATTRLDQQFVLNAGRLMDEGRWLDALPWLTEAYSLHLSTGGEPEPGSPAATGESRPSDPVRDHIHRVRLGILLRETPRLLHLWSDQSASSHRVFSPDGSRYAAGGIDGVARVFRTDTGELVCAIRQEDPRWADPVNHVAFSPDGKWLATAAGDTTGRNGKGSARVWDATTGRPVTARLTHAGNDKPEKRVGQTDFVIRGAGAVLRVEFSPDGKRLYSSSDSGEIRGWGSATGTLLVGPFSHPDKVDRFEVNSDGSRIVALSGSRAWLWNTSSLAWLWNLRNGSAVGEPVPDVPFGAAPRFGPDGSTWVAVSKGVLQTRRSEDGALVGAPVDIAAGLSRLAFAPDGKQLLVTSDGGAERPRLFNMERKFWERSPFPEGSETDDGLPFRPDGRLVLFRDAEGTRLCDVGTGRGVGSRLDAELFSPTGPYLASKLGLWAWPETRMQPLDLHIKSQPKVAIGDDGSVYVAWGWDYNGSVARTHWFEEVGDGSIELRSVELAHEAPVTCATVSPSMDRVATGAGTTETEESGSKKPNGIARVWDSKTGEPLCTPLIHPHGLEMVRVSPDGRWLATVTTVGELRLWKLPDATGPAALPAEQALPQPMPVSAIAFTADSNSLAIASGTERPSATELSVWDLAAGKERWRGARRRMFVTDLTWVGDARLLSHGYRWQEFTYRVSMTELWNAETAALLAEADSEGVASPDGRTVLLGSSLRDAVSGRELRRIPAGDLVYSNDGQNLVSKSPNVRVFDTNTGEPLTAPLIASEAVEARFTPDGHLVVTFQNRSQPDLGPVPEIRVWDARTGEPVSPRMALIDLSPLFDSPPLRVRRDGTRLFFFGNHSTPRVWSIGLTPVEGAFDELRDEAEWRSGRRIDATAGLVEQNRIKAPVRLPGSLDDGKVAIDRWHRLEAELAESERRATVALWHRERLVATGKPDPEANLEMARAAAWFGNAAKAVPMFERLLSSPGWSIDRLSPADGHAFVRALVAARQWARAEEVCRVMNPRVSDREFGFLYAEVLVELGRPGEAERVLVEQYRRSGWGKPKLRLMMTREYDDFLAAPLKEERWSVALLMIRLDEGSSQRLRPWAERIRDEFRALATKEPDNARWRREVIRSEECLANMRRTQDRAAALQGFEACLDAVDGLDLKDVNDALVASSAARSFAEALLDDRSPGLDDGKAKQMARLSSLFERLDNTAGSVDDWRGDRARLLFGSGDLALRTNQPAEALAAFERALSLRRQMSGEADSDDVRECHDRLATAFFDAGRREEVRPHLVAALGIADRREQSLAAARPETDSAGYTSDIHYAREILAYSLKRLAGFEEACKQFTESRPLWERAAKIEKGLAIDPPHGADEPTVHAETLSRLGGVCKELDDDSAAIAYLTEAIARRKSETLQDPQLVARQLVFVLEQYLNLTEILVTDPPGHRLVVKEGARLIPEKERLVELGDDAREAALKYFDSLAWRLATSGNEQLQDGPLAVELALRARELAGVDDADALDTLAAAYARAGRFEEAVATQEAALKALPEDSDARSAWEDRLRLYRGGSGFVE